MSTSSFPKPVIITLFGKRIFAYAINFRILRSSWIMWLDPKCHHNYPYKREAEGDSTNTEEKLEAEVREMRPQAEECQQPLETG